MKRTLLSLLLIAIFVCSTVMPVGASETDSGFTPSATAKPAPEIVQYDKAGAEYAVMLVKTNEDGTETPLRDISIEEIAHVAYSAVTDGAGGEVGEALVSAYNEIAGADDLSVLCPELSDVVSELGSEYLVKNLVATDLFELSLKSTDAAALLNGDPGVQLRVSFHFPLAEGEPAPIVIHRDSITNKWRAVPTESVTVSAKDQITVVFDSLCPVVFLRPVAAEPTAPTFDPVLLAWIAGIALLVLFVFLFIRALRIRVKKARRRAAILEGEEGFLEGYYSFLDKTGSHSGDRLRSKYKVDRLDD